MEEEMGQQRNQKGMIAPRKRSTCPPQNDFVTNQVASSPWQYLLTILQGVTTDGGQMMNGRELCPRAEGAWRAPWHTTHQDAPTGLGSGDLSALSHPRTQAGPSAQASAAWNQGRGEAGSRGRAAPPRTPETIKAPVPASAQVRAANVSTRQAPQGEEKQQTHLLWGAGYPRRAAWAGHPEGRVILAHPWEGSLAEARE